MTINEHNPIYNLATQMTHEMKSLWQIEQYYMSDAQSEEEKVFWKSMIEDKNNHITELRSLLKKVI